MKVNFKKIGKAIAVAGGAVAIYFVGKFAGAMSVAKTLADFCADRKPKSKIGSIGAIASGVVVLGAAMNYYGQEEETPTEEIVVEEEQDELD